MYKIAPKQNRNRVVAALTDLGEGLRRWRLWCALAWWDVRRPYHRTLIGPIWEPLGFAAVIALLAPLFGPSLAAYTASPTAYLGIGYAVWHFISGILLDSTHALQQDGRILLHQPMPVTLFPMRVVARNLIVLVGNLLVISVACIYLDVAIVWDGVAPVLGFVLLIWNALAWGTAMAFLGARFPDLRQFILLAVRMAMFLTPVLWHADMFAGGTSDGPWQLRHIYVDFNPFHHAIEILRSPLLGVEVDSRSVWAVCIMGAVGSLLAMTLTALWRRRVVYWL